MSDTTLARDDEIDARVLLSFLAQVRGGDFSARMPLEWIGVAGKVADGLNEVMIANQALEAELARVTAWSARRASSPSASSSADQLAAGRAAWSR